MNPREKVLIPCLILIVGLLVAGCQEGNPLTTAILPATPGFTPEVVTAPDRHVSLRVGSIDAGRIVLEVVVADVDVPVSGVAMKLTYPGSFSQFVACTDGDLFQPGGTCTFNESSPSEVFLYRGITAPEPAVTISGERVAARVEFLVFGAGTAPIVFEGQNLGASEASAVLDAGGQPIFVEWFSGMLRGD